MPILNSTPYGTIMASQFLKALEELIAKHGDQPILITFDSYCHQACTEPVYSEVCDKCDVPHFLI